MFVNILVVKLLAFPEFDGNMYKKNVGNLWLSGCNE